MPGRKRGLIYCLTVAVLGSQAGPVRAWTYHDDSNRFAIDLPADWVALSARELKIRNAIVRQQLAGFEPTFAAGFSPATGKRHARPCLLIQVDPEPTTGKSVEDFEKEYRAYFAAVRKQPPDATIRMGNRLLFAEPTFEPDRKRFVTTLKSVRTQTRELNYECLLQGDLDTRFEFVGGEGHKARPSAGAGYGYFGPDRLVILYCLTTAANWEKDERQFQGVVDSFRFDTPPEPAVGSEAAGSGGDGGGAAAVTGGPPSEARPRWVAAVAAGGVGLAVAGVGFVVWRRRSAADRPVGTRESGVGIL